MQYHLNGYARGDPAVAFPLTEPESEAPTNTTDVLIVGCGPAGLVLAAQLAAFPTIRTRIVEQKPGPLEVGQADGIACRSMEMFEALGFADRVLKEAYWVNETVFWRPHPGDASRIVRAHRIQDVEDGLSEMPHTILNQARVHDFLIDAMRGGARRLTPDYHRRLTHLTVDASTIANYPVHVTLARTDTGQEEQTESMRARYVVGCDGARSAVRKALGLSLRGDSANKVWGVMDVLAITDFPNIRLKAAIQSANQGSVLVIPREGGYLVRLYIELDSLGASERVADRHITCEQLIAAARRILAPYTLEVKEVAWWSAYEIGQRVSESFDDVPPAQRDQRTPRVFIAGDACHTHSPKAGQGMNVSMADAFNLGWKLAAVLRGQASPTLLHSYGAERLAKARELIDFDRDMAQLFSAKPNAGNASADPALFQQYFAKHGRYTAGVQTRYDASMVIGDGRHQRLAAGLVVGQRFPSSPVIRLADAKPLQLGHVLKADGRWRLIAFSGTGAGTGAGEDASQPMHPGSDLHALCEFLTGAPSSPVRRYTPAGADVDAVIDVRAVLQQGHRDVDLAALPAALLPRKGRHGLIDYEKVFCPDLKSGSDIFDLRAIDRQHGCVVIVRPDQFVANVLQLNDYAALSAFFAAFMLPAGG